MLRKNVLYGRRKITDACAKRYALKEEIFEWVIAGDIARCEAFLQSLLNNE